MDSTTDCDVLGARCRHRRRGRRLLPRRGRRQGHRAGEGGRAGPARHRPVRRALLGVLRTAAGPRAHRGQPGLPRRPAARFRRRSLLSPRGVVTVAGPGAAAEFEAALATARTAPSGAAEIPMAAAARLVPVLRTDRYARAMHKPGGAHSCCIYDKTTEIAVSRKDWMQEVWIANGWDGEVVSPRGVPLQARMPQGDGRRGGLRLPRSDRRPLGVLDQAVAAAHHYPTAIPTVRAGRSRMPGRSSNAPPSSAMAHQRCERERRRAISN